MNFYLWWKIEFLKIDITREKGNILAILQSGSLGSSQSQIKEIRLRELTGLILPVRVLVENTVDLNYYWSIVDLKCCVSFLLYSKVNWLYIYVCVCILITQSHLTLHDLMDYNLPSSFVHGILQARIWEWSAISSSRASSPPRDWTHVSCLAGIFFTTEPPGKPH